MATSDIWIGPARQKLSSKRLVGHKRDYVCWLNYKVKYATSYDILKYGDGKMRLLETKHVKIDMN